MKVPLCDVNAEIAAHRGDIQCAIERVLDSGQLILGREVVAFEAQLAVEVGVDFVVGVSSGSDALLATLMALGVGEGDEVITTPFTFFATAGAIVRLGAAPVFVDVEPGSLTMDPRAALDALTPRTKAIIPVHLFGRQAMPLTAKGVPVIEDAAQALGSGHVWGEAACYSFFPTKNLGGLGDGGAVATRSEKLAKRIRRLRQHGMDPDRRYVHTRIGGNFRLDAIQAAVLRAKLPHLYQRIRSRQRMARLYRDFFNESRIHFPAELVLPEPSSRHTYNQFVIQVPRRDELRAHLEAAGIGTAVYYPVPLHLQPCFTRLRYKPGQFPVAEKAALECLALPMGPHLTDDQAFYVVKTAAEFYNPTIK
jgi:dTDP-4-amino-4,6-dideoxygalactose transaminase